MIAEIRAFEDNDWNELWRIIEPVFRSGETYAFPSDLSEGDAFQAWIEFPAKTYVAVDKQNSILGTYYIKPNQPGQGSHVCNCGYIVADRARGQGIASEMCKHSQIEALAQGYLAMQFNLVVASNEGAVRLWKSLGFEIVGTLRSAFRHPEQGFVDAHIMFKTL